MATHIPPPITDILDKLKKNKAHGITKLVAYVTRISNQAVEVESVKNKIAISRKEMTIVSEEAKRAVARATEKLELAEGQVRNLDRELTTARRRIVELESQGRGK